MRKISGKIISGLILVSIAYWFVSSIISDRRVEEEKQELKDEKQLQIEKSITDIVTKYNAVTDWKDKNSFSLSEPTYTVEVEDALVRTDDRPIKFFAAVEDVVKEANRYSVYFHNWIDVLLSADIHFVLDCTPDQVNEIMLNPRALFESNYVVIAKVSEIKKVKLKVTTSTENDDFTIEPSNVFIAKGQCLDLLFVGDYEPRDSFMEKLE